MGYEETMLRITTIPHNKHLKLKTFFFLCCKYFYVGTAFKGKLIIPNQQIWMGAGVADMDGGGGYCIYFKMRG